VNRSLARVLLPVLAAALGGCAPMDVYRSHLLPTGDQTRPGLFVTWLGTAGVLVSDGTTGILIDPYVSRFGLCRVIFGMKLHPDRDLIRQWVARTGSVPIRAVVVSHSHFDHALDAPFFARETGAPLVGSQSTRNIGLGAGLPGTQVVAVQPGRTMTLGAFTLTFLESAHGPALFGRVPYPGTVEEPLIPPRPAGDYRLGTTFSILITHPCGTILHHGSAGFVPGMYAGVRSDVVLLGITGRGDTREYLAQVPLQVRARTLVPIHFDDFFQPLEEGLSFLYTSHFAEFCATAGEAGLAVRTLPVGEPVRVLPLD
jgi:L-ascorbate metabolism protein UlaG (beta-lactamase superfamily)